MGVGVYLSWGYPGEERQGVSPEGGIGIPGLPRPSALPNWFPSPCGTSLSFNKAIPSSSSLSASPSRSQGQH